MDLHPPVRLTPDGARYLALANGTAQPLPFHLRWLLPRALGPRPWAWVVTAWVSAVALAAGTTALGLTHGLDHHHALAAGLLVAGLPSVRLCLMAPILVDLPGLAVTTWSAALAPDHPWLAIALSILAGAVWEKAGLFAALFSGNPLLLAGLASPALRLLYARPGAIDPRDPLRQTLENPLRAGIDAHRGAWRDPWRMLTPWGACGIALFAPTPLLAATLAAGYAQLLIATDTVRLYQAAAPLVAVTAAGVIPSEWLIPAMVLHWLNPWSGDGV